MGSSIDIFFRLDDALIDNQFSIRKRLYRTNRKHVIEGVNKFRHVYRVDYDENSLTLTIRRRFWLVFNKVVAQMKINADDEGAIRDVVCEITNILLK